MTFEAGTTVELQVSREATPYGYFLTNGDEDVLLHNLEKTRDLKLGETISVFLFHDSEDRLTATMREPLITMGKVALLEVVDIHPQIGSFLDIGLGRNLLLPFAGQPETVVLRARKGDKVFVTLSHDRQGRLVAKAAGEDEFVLKVFHAPTSWMNQWFDARVYKPMEMGTFVIVEGGVLGFGAIGFIHSTERTRPLRVGEVVKVRVVFIREDGRVNLSMRQVKQVGREEDSEKILAFLKARPDGAMPYSDSTPADVILTKFGISKGAFKRALGKLMKDGLVEQKDEWTRLKETKSSETEPSETISSETEPSETTPSETISTETKPSE
ncbi:MAG: RNA-binding protein [Gorillibacterium sp.]|nr:RNA-binding protein [Gorillibacterium sp.]